MNILWFSEISNNDVQTCGGKGASLGEMYNIGLPIPPGFVITAEAYKNFLEINRIDKQIYNILSTIDLNDSKGIELKSNEIQEIILKSEIPKELKDEITESYENLDVNEEVLKFNNKSALSIIKTGRSLPYVAVRSSATAEDSPEFSFAGQQSTYLNVKGISSLLISVKKCWASLFTARSIYYREKNKIKHETVFLAVVIQKMVNSYSSGIMFTINPVTNNENEIVIESGYGLGELIVSGTVNPNNYVIDKENMTIKSKTTPKQDNMLVREEMLGKNIKRKIPENYPEQVLNDSQIISLANYGVKIEKHYQKPMDIEFAIENSKIYIVQSRPVTTLKKPSFEEIKPIENSEEILKGLAASPGIASGYVKIIRNVSELDKVQKGDILVTKMTNPDYVLAMERASAIVTDEGGSTAHASIVSRELGIPCIVGTEKATQLLKDNQFITVDGSHGIVYQGKVDLKEEKQEDFKHYDTITKVKINLDLPSQSERASKADADGIGLVRIEFIIAENGVHPSKYIKDNNFDEYINVLFNGLSKIVEHFKDKPVWIRTSDIRTDEYKNLEGAEDEIRESNPMIGWHGIRRGLDDIDLLKCEFTAIKKLHDLGYKKIGIMLPFVISVDEVKKAKTIMKEIGLNPIQDIDFGIMVETPASVFIIEELCKEGISFISFGTNDLTQTILGVDRGNDKIQYLYNEMNPAVLKAIKHCIEICKKYNVETSICGQAGSNEKMAELLVKYGIDSISVNLDAINKIRNIVYLTEKKLLLNVARKGGV